MNQMPGLLSELSSVENKKHLGALAEFLFWEWGKVDSELSMEAINTLEDKSMVASAMTGMMPGWAAKDGRSALELSFFMVNNSIRNGDSSEDTVKLLDSYETEEMRDRGLGNIISVASQKEYLKNSVEL